MEITLGIGFFSLSAVIGLVFAVMMHIRHGLGLGKRVVRKKARKAAKKKR